MGSKELRNQDKKYNLTILSCDTWCYVYYMKVSISSWHTVDKLTTDKMDLKLDINNPYIWYSLSPPYLT